MTETELPPHRWRTILWLLLAIGNVALLAYALLQLQRGTPDTYLNQHARLAASATAGLGLALVFVLRRPALQLTAMAGTIAAIVWQISLLS